MPTKYDEVTFNKKPDWLKIKLHDNSAFSETSTIVSRHRLHTICESGRCPNKAECWSRRTATFMILGEICTRSCKFCATSTGRPLPPDAREPGRVADSISLMGLKHCVITSVTRDDLADQGAKHWADVVKAIRTKNPETTIELLIPDLDATPALIDIVLESAPDIVGHNIETVRRLTPEIRSKAKYDTSLKVLEYIASRGFTAKSGIMVGLGETKEEVLEAMDDLASAGCRILTIGQYLRPTKAHVPVAEYVTPETFDRYKEEGLKRGFGFVASGPLVRSSYMAEKALEGGGIQGLQ